MSRGRGLLVAVLLSVSGLSVADAEAWMRRNSVFWYENPGKSGVRWTAQRIHAAELVVAIHGTIAGHDDHDVGLNKGTNARSAVSRKVGMELWSYRNQLAQDLPGTLALIRRLGVTDIETASFYNRSAAEFRRALDDAGLTCSSIIPTYDKLKGDLASVVADAKAVGAKYVLTAGFPHKGQLKPRDVHSAAADFNLWGKKLKQAGLQFGYHPHGFEFVPSGTGNLFDVLLSETKPGLVTYEMDVFWFVCGGADPLRYLQKHPGRFTLMHLRDMAKGTETGLKVGKVPKESSVAMGTGTFDWRTIFTAAKRAGVKLYYIEDDSPAAPAQIPVSLNYLKSFDL